MSISTMKHTSLLLLLLCSAFLSKAQRIATIAGADSAGYSGDNIPAIGAALHGPFGVAINMVEEVFFADRSNARIRKIGLDGVITTIAGTGVPGYNGDNIPATAAQINDPIGVAADAQGNVYFADKNNHRIRMINTDGNIITVAGTGVAGFGGDSALATSAQLFQPRGLAVDTFGNIYIADQGNNRVRKINRVTGIITTIAGNGALGYGGDNGPAKAAMLNGPYAVAVDYFGNIYISDVDNERIRKVDLAGVITTIAGTGTAGYNGDNIPATDAQLYEPIGVAVDNTGSVFIADAWNDRIRKILPSGIITTLSGDGIAGVGADSVLLSAAKCNNPYGIAYSFQGTLAIADYGNNRVRKSYASGLGIAAQSSVIGVSIYPNPSSNGYITVDMTTPAKEIANITVTDVLGRQVYTTAANTNQKTELQLSVPPGIYIVTVQTVKSVITQQLSVIK